MILKMVINEGFFSHFFTELKITNLKKKIKEYFYICVAVFNCQH